MKDDLSLILMGVNSGETKEKKKYYYVSLWLTKGFNQDTAKIFINEETYKTISENLNVYQYQNILPYITFDYDFKNRQTVLKLDLSE